MGKGLNHRAVAPKVKSDNAMRHAGKGQLAPAKATPGSSDDLSNQGAKPLPGASANAIPAEIHYRRNK